MNTRKSIAVALVCALGSAAALASEANSVHHVTVKYSDLNMNTVAGATTLYGRIRGAARFACGEQGRRFEELREWNSCYHAAIAEAVANVNSPLLTSVHNGSINVTAMR
jgi:UrcA family protein